MIEIGLVERAALAAIDRAGIAVPELLKLSGIEDERLRLPAVELHGDLAALDLLDDAGIAVGDAGLLVGAGELDAVAGRERGTAVRRGEAGDPRPARRAACAPRARRR